MEDIYNGVIVCVVFVILFIILIYIGVRIYCIVYFYLRKIFRCYFVFLVIDIVIFVELEIY